MNEHHQNSALSYSETEQGFGTIFIDVPGEKMNTLRDSFAPELENLLENLENKPLKGLMIVSGKADNFIVGADIKMLDACDTEQQVLEISKRFHSILFRLQALPFPSVSLIHGPALGGGLELALACDYRICSDSSITKFGLPEVQLGLLPGGGGTQRLPKLIGIQQALDLMLTGKQIVAKKAVKIGLVDEKVAESQLTSVAEKWLRKGKARPPKVKQAWWKKSLERFQPGRELIFQQAGKTVLAKTNGNYPAPEAIIRCVKAGAEQHQEIGYQTEAKEFAALCLSSESAYLRGLFLTTTEMKKSYPATEADHVSRLAVLGGGLMGAGISYISASKAKSKVRLKDITSEGVNHGLAYSYKLLQKKVKRRFITPIEAKQQMAQITGTTDYSGFRDLDLVIEAVFEDLAVKQQMVADVEQHSHEHCIFASNTSSIPIAQIAEQAKRPENVVGLHYFSPAEKMPLVEVIPHQGTAEATVNKVVNFARAQGKTPIVVKDKAGFYVNRILAPYINEAAYLLLEGEPIEKIDQALEEFGFPVGPMTLLDEVGIDIASKIAPILENELGARFTPPEAFNRLIESGFLGKKSGQGFYQYPTKKTKKQVNQAVYSLLGVQNEPQLNKEEIAKRCVNQMLNEAVRCLEEGVISSVKDGDIGAIFGIGFPPFHGGPFHYIDKVGAVQISSELSSLKNIAERFSPCEALLEKAEAEQKFHS